MTLAVDTPNIIADPTSFNGTSTSTSVTVGASDNLLVVCFGATYNSGPAAPPDGITYNSVALTLLSTNNQFGNWNTSIWYLSAPPTGTHTLASTFTTNTSGGAACITAVPMSGAATSSIFGTPAKNQSSINSNPAVTATGGATGSLYLAATFNGIQTTTGTGAGQTDISATNSIGSGTNGSFDVSTIAGSGSGAFTWTGSGTLNSTNWMAIGVNINAASAPIRQACVADSAATSATTESGTFALATLAGSSILVVCTASSTGGNSFTSFTDPVNGIYQPLDLITDSTAFGLFRAFVFQNAASVSSAQSLTVTASVAKPHLAFAAYEIQATSNNLAGHTAQLQTVASAAINAISSGGVQSGLGSSLAVAVSINSTGNIGATSDPLVGSGYTIAPSPGGNFWTAFGGLQATAEYQTFASPTLISGTFTAQGATSDHYITFLAVFGATPLFAPSGPMPRQIYIMP